MTLAIILIALGFLFLIKGADWLVDGASSLAKKHQIPDLAIGLTIVAFGTSAPELVVNAFASFEEHPDIVFGNIIGSNNFNLFVILGIVGLIFPLTVQSTTVWKEIPYSFLAAIVLLFLANGFLFSQSNGISRLDGLFLLILFGLFLFYIYRQMKNDASITAATQEVSQPNFKIWGLIAIGLTGLILGGKLVVDNAVIVATNLGVSEKVIGLTIIAAGTSLPELVTSFMAALKKNNDIAIGNIIGSNIFNVFLILSISSFIRPIEYNTLFNVDIYLLLSGTTFLFLAMFVGKKHKLQRWQAGTLLLIFVVYTLFLIQKEV